MIFKLETETLATEGTEGTEGTEKKHRACQNPDF